MAKASSKPLAAPPVERKVIEEEETTEKGGPKKRKTLRAKVEKVSAIAAVLTVRNLARTNPLLLEEQGEEHANRREIVHSHRHRRMADDYVHATYDLICYTSVQYPPFRSAYSLKWTS